MKKKMGFPFLSALFTFRSFSLILTNVLFLVFKGEGRLHLLGLIRGEIQLHPRLLTIEHFVVLLCPILAGVFHETTQKG